MSKTFTTKYGEISSLLNDDLITSLLEDNKIYEEEYIINLIIPILQKNKDKLMILDIGGHIGIHSIIYSKLLNCDILTFEPQTKIFELLKKNIKDNNLINCSIYNCAVGHNNIHTTLSDTLYDGYNCKIEYDTTKRLNYGGIGLGLNGEKCQMITIDSLNLIQCDYIKIDIEGAEILALMGAKETINKFKPLIWFEFTDKIVSDEMKKSLNINNDMYLPSVKEYLTNFGYSFVNIDKSNILGYILTNNNHQIDINLELFENTIYSESGEDGILVILFQLYKAYNKIFVEIGVKNGIQANTRALAEFANFKGVLFDKAHENSDINLYKYKITEDNIIELLIKYNIPVEFDLLSIDINSFDFYVLRKILSKHVSRIIICKYNAIHLPHEDKIILRNTVDTDINNIYFGASILAFTKLAQKYNYSLVYANKKGLKLFFVRNELINSSIYNIINRNNIKKIYRTPKNTEQIPFTYNNNYNYISSNEII